MKRLTGTLFLLIVAACVWADGGRAAEKDPNSDIPEMTVKKDLVIITSTGSYKRARRTAEAAAANLAIPLDLRELASSSKTGLTLSKQACEENGWDYP